MNADGYIQQFDERGHPINPTSKSSGKELRRAKNDVLSTMGIVVSGEDGSGPTSKERQKANLLIAENDYGLIMATLDQVMTFLTSWWSISLGCRIQVRITELAMAGVYANLARLLGITRICHFIRL